MFKTLINVDELAQQIENPSWLLVDCRSDLADLEAGRNAYKKGHLPGAVFAHLDEDLSGEIIPGKTGRHPLSPPAKFLAILHKWGLNTGDQVIVYDDKGGGIAARLWWMLKAMGHESVALLNGGIQAWEAAGLGLSAEIPDRKPGNFVMNMQENVAVNVSEVEEKSRTASPLLIDARAAIRYRGEKEPIDPVAGHIPSAVSAPWMENLNPDKTFKSDAELRSRFEEVLQGVSPEDAISYCGSGVTACHNLLAMEHVGIRGVKLYPGSWSHWITDKNRGVEKN